MNFLLIYINVSIFKKKKFCVYYNLICDKKIKREFIMK